MMAPPLSTGVVVLLVAAVLGAVADWVVTSRPSWHRVRWYTKGLAPALLVVALALRQVEEPKPSWAGVIAAGGLCLCLLGDYLLLDTYRFVPGTVAFAAAHLVFAAAFLWDSHVWGWPVGWGAYAALAVVAVGLLAVGWRLVAAGAVRGEGTAVSVYLVVISVMVLAAGVHAAAPDGLVALLGAVLFYLSDGIIGWRRYVRRAEHDSVAVMVLYHLALFALTWWALDV